MEERAELTLFSSLSNNILREKYMMFLVDVA